MQGILRERRQHPPVRFDIVPWLAGLCIVALVGIIVLRKANQHLSLDLSRDVLRYMTLAVWWLYWGSVVFFGLVVIRRWQNSYFRWRTLATIISQTVFGLFLIGPLKTYLAIPTFWQRLHLTWPLHMSVITPSWQDRLPSIFMQLVQTIPHLIRTHDGLVKGLAEPSKQLLQPLIS